MEPLAKQRKRDAIGDLRVLASELGIHPCGAGTAWLQQTEALEPTPVALESTPVALEPLGCSKLRRWNPPLWRWNRLAAAN